MFITPMTIVFFFSLHNSPKWIKRKWPRSTNHKAGDRCQVRVIRDLPVTNQLPEHDALQGAGPERGADKMPCQGADKMPPMPPPTQTHRYTLNG